MIDSINQSINQSMMMGQIKILSVRARDRCVYDRITTNYPPLEITHPAEERCPGTRQQDQDQGPVMTWRSWSPLARGHCLPDGHSRESSRRAQSSTATVVHFYTKCGTRQPRQHEGSLLHFPPMTRSRIVTRRGVRTWGVTRPCHYTSTSILQSSIP
jgi:hypothetical protein